MFSPCRTKSLLLLLALLACALITSSAQAGTRFQQSATASSDERERGINLYKQGDIKGAIKVLSAVVDKNKSDADAWHFLGLALNLDGKLKEARKAFEMAAKLRPDFAPAHTGLAYLLFLTNKSDEAAREAERALSLSAQNEVAHYVLGAISQRNNAPSKALEEAEAALKAKADFPPALLLKSQALFALYLRKIPYSSDTIIKDTKEARAERGRLLKESTENLEKYLQLEPHGAEAKLWQEQLATLRIYAGFDNKQGDEQVVFPSSAGVTKARILSRAEPQYSETARRAGVSGMVILRAVLSSDGTVKHILVIRGLPYGLTQEAIQAARKIKFVPATKDGKPVSQFIQIEYGFYLG